MQQNPRRKQRASIVRNFLSENGAIISIVILAVVLRFVFFTGNFRGDGDNYVNSALLLYRGDSPFTDWAGSNRIGLYFPISLLFFVFGPRELSALIFPILTSLLSIIAIYGIGKLQVSKASGQIAAFIWALWPLDIFLASQVLPDGPMTSMSLVSVYFWLLSFKSNNKSLPLLLSAFFIGWAILIKPLALMIPLFYAFYYLFNNFSLINRSVAEFLNVSSIRATLIFVSVLAVISFFVQTQPRNALLTISNTSSDLFQLLIIGKTHIDFSDLRVTQSYLFVYLAPLFLIAIVTMLLDHRAATNKLLAWAGFVVIYYEWGTINNNFLLYKPINNFVEARNFLIASAPIIILLGVFLSKSLEDRLLEKIIPTYSALYGFFAILLKPTISLLDQNILIQTLRNVFMVLSLLSPFYFFRYSDKQKTVVFLGLLFVLSIILLVPTPPDHYTFFEQSRDLFQDWDSITHLYE